MPDRLQELLQQRALIKEHLAWLESEIAAASGKPLPPDAPSPALPVQRAAIRPAEILIAKTAAPDVPISTATTLRQDAEADALLQKLAARDNPSPPPSKTGCWVIFSVILLLLLGGGWIVISHFYPHPIQAQSQQNSNSPAGAATPSR